MAICGLAPWVFPSAAALVAEIPTRAERVRDSGLNPAVQVWRAPEIRPAIPVDREPLRNVCYRYEFKAPVKVRGAAISLTACSRATVFVNGRKIAEPLPGRGVPILTYDLTEHLKPGRNVLGVRKQVFGEGLQPPISIAAEGVIFGVDGSVTRLLSGVDWRSGIDLDDGWEMPGFEGSDMPPARPLNPGKPAKLDFNPPYHGMIDVRPSDMREPIFDEGRSCELAIRIVNGAPVGRGAPLTALTVEVFDEVARKVLSESGVGLTNAGMLDLSGALKFGPLARGAYRLRFVLMRGGVELDRRDYEVAVVGRIPQREVEGSSYEDGLDLREIWSVDCATEPDEKTFLCCEGGNRLKGEKKKARKEGGQFVADLMEFDTVVKKGPAGTYREIVFDRLDDRAKRFGRSYLATFGYRFKHRRLYVPHLAVVE